MFPEQLEQVGVADLLRVVDHQHALGVARQTAAHLFIGRIGGETTLIAGGGDIDAGLLPEQSLDAPETAHGKIGQLQSGRVGRQHAVTADGM